MVCIGTTFLKKFEKPATMYTLEEGGGGLYTLAGSFVNMYYQDMRCLFSGIRTRSMKRLHTDMPVISPLDYFSCSSG